MAEERVQRKLTTIFAADVEGYTRLMRADEEATLKTLGETREIIDGLIARHDGRVFSTGGDSVLAEFGSAVEAVRCAMSIQEDLAVSNTELAEDRRMRLRIGINVGDVMVEGDDLFGDGVNVAARLEGLANAGGICISGSTFDQVKNKLSVGFEDLGAQEVKNIAEAIRVYSIRLDGEIADTPTEESSELQQKISFCTSTDGVRIAYATVGDGYPLVKAASFMTHLEFDLDSPVWQHLVRDLSKNHTFIRYDQRGNGLSDWEVDDFSLERFVGDLEAVVDAAGLERFALFGLSQSCPVCITYAVRHPERVSHLVLYGGATRGANQRSNSMHEEQRNALITLIRHGWGQENPAFRQIFTSRFIPDGNMEQFKWFNELQRIATPPENAARIYQAIGEVEVSELAKKIDVPTLVLHCREDGVVPFDEGRRMASIIPGAQFVGLESRNHLLFADEPAWERFLNEVSSFLAPADHV